MRTTFLTSILALLIAFSSACKGTDQSKANSNNSNAANPNGNAPNPAQQDVTQPPAGPQSDPTSTGVPPTGSSAAEISMIAMDFHSSLLQGDKARLESLLAEDYQRTRVDGKVVNRTQELASLKKSDEMFSMEAQPAQVNGDTATVTGKIILSAADMSGKKKGTLQTTDTFKKRNDKWVVVSSVEKKG